MNKLKRFLFPTEEEDLLPNPKTNPVKPLTTDTKNGPSKGTTVPTSTGANPNQGPYIPQQMGLFTPSSFEEAMPIVREMIKLKRVIVSIDKLWGDDAHKLIAQRLIDYLCGAAYALNFEVQKINEMAFLFEQSLPKI